MKEWKKQTTVFKLLTLVGLVVTSMLSACGGGSQGGAEQISPGNKFYTFVGTYSDNKCWSDIPSGPYSALGSQFVLSPSTKPNTLNMTNTYFYYRNDDKGNRCGVKIGSSVAHGEMTYVGTAPSVEFSNSSRPSLEATKFVGNFNKVVNEGVYGTNFDALDDYGSGLDSKFLFARSANLLYSADFDSPRDSEGFPTKLTPNRLAVGSMDISSTHQLGDYIGTYSTNQCAFPYQFPFYYTGRTNQIVFSASEKPNTLKVTNTSIYYQYDSNSFVVDDARCGTQIGSSVAYGEITFLGTSPSVQFSNLTKEPMGADKFQMIISEVVNQGVFDSKWDEIIDYNIFAKSLLALDGRVIYAANYSSLADVEGFPTQLDQYTFWVRQ